MPRTVQLFNLTVTPTQIAVAAGLLIVLVALIVAVGLSRRARARARRRRERTEAALAARALAPFPPTEPTPVQTPTLPPPPPRERFVEPVYSEPARNLVQRRPDPDARSWESGAAERSGAASSDPSARASAARDLSDPDKTDRLPSNQDAAERERDTERRDAGEPERDTGRRGAGEPERDAERRDDAEQEHHAISAGEREHDGGPRVHPPAPAPSSAGGDDTASGERNGQPQTAGAGPAVTPRATEPASGTGTAGIAGTVAEGAVPAAAVAAGAVSPGERAGSNGDDATDPKDRLLRVLLADPDRALRAVRDLEASRAQLDRLNESLHYQRRQLADAARRLRRAGLTPAQVAQLAGFGEGELVSLLAEHSPSPTPRSLHDTRRS